MKIVIVGGGIAGLTAYFFLDKFLSTLVPDLDIHLYESYKSPSIGIGGTLGLAPNGLHTIRLLSEEAHARILETGFPCAKFEFRTSSGKVMGLMPVGSPERYPGTGGEVMHSRAGIYEEILKVLEENNANIHYGKMVSRVVPKDQGMEVTFENGEVVLADLVVGADGIRSTVRKAAFPGVEARFEGLVGVGSIVPATIIAESELPKTIPYDYKDTKYSPTVMTMGRNGFFGYSPINSKTGSEGRYQWWSTAEVDSEDRDLPVEEIERQLLERHKGWVNPRGESVIENIIKAAVAQHKECLDTNDRSKRMLVLPNYYMQKMDNYQSDDGRILLMGDAAHVMPPHSGQGVSLAAEDGYAYAKLLAHAIENRADKVKGYNEALKVAGKQFTEFRKPRNDKIMAIAEKSGNTKRNLRFYEEFFRNLFFGLFLTFAPESIHDESLGYRVDEEVEKYLKTKS